MQINDKAVKENLGAIIDAGYISRENYKEIIEVVGGVNNLKRYNPSQLSEMIQGLKDGLTVAQIRNYADPKNHRDKMQQIRANLVKEQRNIPEELKQLKDFLTLAGNYGKRLAKGNTVEDLTQEIKHQKPTEAAEQMDALAYISAKLGIGTKVPTVNKRIQEMKTKNHI